MSLFDPVANIKTFIAANYSFANVNSAVTGTPLDAVLAVYTDDEYRYQSIDTSNGILKILNSDSKIDDFHESYQHELWILECELIYRSSSSEILKAIMSEIQRAFNAHNDDDDITERYLWTYAYNLNFATGKLQLVISIERRWVSKDI